MVGVNLRAYIFSGVGGIGLRTPGASVVSPVSNKIAGQAGWCRELGAELGGPKEDTGDVEELVLKCHPGSLVHQEQGVLAVTQEAHTKVRQH